MVLLPVAIVTQMPPEMLEAIVAHELAHIRRYDLWVNLAQRVVETLLFYHPAVWWLSHRLRNEREFCCDELAVQATGERLAYASALEIAGRTRSTARQPVLALGLGRGRQSTLGRVRHVLGLPPLPPDPRFWLAGVITVALLVLVALPAVSILTARAANQSSEGAGADFIFGNPTNLGPSVNSPADDYDPSISADELELYLNSYRPGGLGQADLWVATRKTNADPWGEPVNLGPTVNSPAGDKAPCISADGLSLYFSSDRPGGQGGEDLWVTTRKSKSAPWGEPVNLGPAVNSPANEHGPSVSADDLTLYFSVWPDKSPEGWDQSDLWMTTRKTKQDPWAAPVNLGPTVNSPAYDGSPSIAKDGLSLYFNSERGGGSAIWVTTRKSTDAPWGTPEKLGPVVNADWEANPDISRDGSTLYFVSTRPGSVGRTDLWQATLGKSSPESKAGDLERAEKLLVQGADVNARDEYGNTPLHYAARNPDAKNGFLYLLIAKGAEVNARNDSGQTPLHLAVQVIRKTAVATANSANILLSHGAQADTEDKNGCTPLYVACGSDWTNTVEVLLAKGAKIDEKTNDGLTPLHRAAMLGRANIVEVLLRWMGRGNEALRDSGGAALPYGSVLDSRDGRGYTPLHYAAMAGANDIVERLISNDADVSARNARGQTPVHLAVVYNRREAVKLLLAKGAEVSSIQVAAYVGDLAKVKSLMERGINVEAQDGSGLTPLHAAAGAGQKEMVEFLIGRALRSIPVWWPMGLARRCTMRLTEAPKTWPNCSSIEVLTSMKAIRVE